MTCREIALCENLGWPVHGRYRQYCAGTSGLPRERERQHLRILEARCLEWKGKLFSRNRRVPLAGDLAEWLLRKIGVTERLLTKILGRNCGCRRRKVWLNRLDLRMRRAIKNALTKLYLRRRLSC